MTNRLIVFRIHAIQRMFERGVSDNDVRHVMDTGETIENYPDDAPYPSRLILGWRGMQPIHVVIADNKEDNEIIVITVYVPDPGQWREDYRRRKK